MSIEQERADAAIMALNLAEVRIRELEAQIAARDAAPMELIEALRDKWSMAGNEDAMTLFLVAIAGGIKTEWWAMAPENGFVTSVNFAEIGKLQIEIRKVNGRTAGEVLNEMGGRLNAFTEATREFLAAWDSDGNLNVNRAVAAKDRLRALVEPAA